MYNFLELKTEIAKLVQRSNDTAYIAKIGTWINLAQDFLYNSYDYYIELKGEHNFTTVDGTVKYYMPSDLEKITRFYDVTNNKKIDPNIEETYFDENIASIADEEESDANTYYLKEAVGVKVQVATTGDTLQVKSSSASDIAVIARIEGYVDSSLTILGFENITVIGTTYVAGTTTFYKITRVSKDSDSVGYITVADSSDTVLAVMQSIDRVLRHKVVELRLIPDDSTTNMRVLYKKRIRKLVNDYDYPFIEADSYFILDGWGWALAQEKETMDRAQTIWNKAEKALFQIIYNQSNKMSEDYQQKLITSFAQAHRA